MAGFEQYDSYWCVAVPHLFEYGEELELGVGEHERDVAAAEFVFYLDGEGCEEGEVVFAAEPGEFFQQGVAPGFALSFGCCLEVCGEAFGGGELCDEGLFVHVDGELHLGPGHAFALEGLTRPGCAGACVGVEAGAVVECCTALVIL